MPCPDDRRIITHWGETLVYPVRLALALVLAPALVPELALVTRACRVCRAVWVWKDGDQIDCRRRCSTV